MRESLAVWLLVLSGATITVGSFIEYGLGVSLIVIGIWAFVVSYLLGRDA